MALKTKNPLLIIMSLALKITKSMKVPMMTDQSPMAKMMSFMVAADQKKATLPKAISTTDSKSNIPHGKALRLRRIAMNRQTTPIKAIVMPETFTMV